MAVRTQEPARVWAPAQLSSRRRAAFSPHEERTPASVRVSSFLTLQCRGQAAEPLVGDSKGPTR